MQKRTYILHQIAAIGENMASRVTVKMNTCSKTHNITATMRDDGDIDIKIESDCRNVQEYARRLTRVTMDDLMSFNESRIVSPECREPLLVPCLCPMGVFNAAWMECGLLSKNLCNRVRSNEIVLDENKDRS